MNILETIGKIIKLLSKKKISNLYKIQKLSNPQTDPGIRDIFLWAVLIGMDMQTIRLIWSKLNKDQVVSAVIASTMMKSMAELIGKRLFTLRPKNPFLGGTRLENVHANLEIEAEYYEQMSDEVLQVCYKTPFQPSLLYARSRIT